MGMQTAPQQLEQQVRFDARHPAAVQLETALPGQVLLIGMRAGQHLRDHRVATPITIQVVRGEGTLTAAGAAYPAHAGVFMLARRGRGAWCDGGDRSRPARPPRGSRRGGSVEPEAPPLFGG